MPNHTEKKCSYHLRQGMTSHQCVSSLKTMFPAALTDDEERRGFRQVQQAGSRSLSWDALNSPLEQLLCLPMRGVQTVYTVMPTVISIPVLTLVAILKQGGVNIPQEELWEYWVPKSSVARIKKSTICFNAFLRDYCLLGLTAFFRFSHCSPAAHYPYELLYI